MAYSSVIKAGQSAVKGSCWVNEFEEKTFDREKKIPVFYFKEYRIYGELLQTTTRMSVV